MNIPTIPPEVRAAVGDVVKSTLPLLDDLVARCVQTDEGRVFYALTCVKRSHGRARREALAELDRVVTKCFPPVEGAPLPSEELNGKADVLPGTLCVGADYSGGSDSLYWCDKVEPGYSPFPLPSPYGVPLAHSKKSLL